MDVQHIQVSSTSRAATKVCGAVHAIGAALTAVALVSGSIAVALPATAFAHAAGIEALDPPVAVVDLGAAAPFAVLSGASVGNTVTGPTTVVRGDLGVSAPAGAVTGFPPGIVTGTQHASGATATVAAHDDLVAAYETTEALTPTPALAGDFDGDLIGRTLAPGIHHSAGAVANTGTVTLDAAGDHDAVFILQIGGALSMAAGAKVVLANGAQASHVFWQANGAGALGAGVLFAGTLMAHDAIAVGAGSTVNGRALALTGAISLNSVNIYSSPPAVTISGGTTSYTRSSTPTISGTTDAAVGSVVVVSVGTQTMDVVVQAGGNWSVVAASLLNSTYTVTASSTDVVGNVGTADQLLTVDTVPPVVTIAGGDSLTTADSTPTIVGAADVAPGSVITVTVGGQTLTALVQGDSSWNITPLALADGTYTVTAQAVDPAGNPGSTTQSFIVDTTAPLLSITGGATVLTRDATPTITGTTDEAAGSVVGVTIGTQSVSATVQADHSWAVTAVYLADATYPVVASITDQTAHTATATQSLTIDTIAPVVTIAGGANSTTGDSTPTIVGTADVAVGSVITVTVGAQTLTALVQTDGSWNITPLALANGTYTVTVTATDAAGNIGAAAQSLTIAVVLVVQPAGLDYTPVGPKRVIDTRPGQSPDALRVVPKVKIGGGHEIEVQITGLTGLVPTSGVGAVSLNVTVVDPLAGGYVTVYACGPRADVSSVNYAPGQTVANAVITPVSATGTVCIFSSQSADVIVDINGWFATARAFTPVGPVRVFDTRPGQSPEALLSVGTTRIQAGTVLEVPFTNLAGYVPPTGVSAVSLNVTVVDPAASAYVTAYACGVRELVSSVNFDAGQTVANAVIVPVSGTGTVCFYSVVTTDLIVDINGWFAAGSGFTAINPHRILDTRPGESADALRAVVKQKVGGSYVLRVKVTGFTGLVPDTGVGAVSLNVTATNSAAAGYVTVNACGALDEASTLNYGVGTAVANAALAPVSPTGEICVYSVQPVDIIIDINGWFSN